MYKVFVATLALALAGCQPQTVNMESDDTYAESVAQLRASLDTEAEREFLLEALMEIREVADEEHWKLLQERSPTPERAKQLQEKELEHKIRLREVLHGKDLDGIAQTYRDTLTSRLDASAGWMERSIRDHELLSAVELRPVQVDELEWLRGIGAGSRTLVFSVANGSQATLADYISVDCRRTKCDGDECEVNLLLSIEGALAAGEARVFEAEQYIMKKSEDHLEGASADSLVCSIASANILGPDGETRFLYPGNVAEAVRGLEQAKALKELADESGFEGLYRFWLAHRNDE